MGGGLLYFPLPNLPTKTEKNSRLRCMVGLTGQVAGMMGPRDQMTTQVQVDLFVSRGRQQASVDEVKEIASQIGTSF